MKLRGRLFFFGLVIMALSMGVAVATGQSSRTGIGAVPYADANGTGVMFRTWAPNASSVRVRGTFNGWGTTTMAKDTPGGNWNGHWSVDVPRAKAGDEYKFDLNGSWRKDPRGKRVVNSAGNSIVYDPASFNWDGHAFNRIWRNDLVIYQMHVGTYNAEDWLPSTFDECLEKLPHIKAMGFSAVKLMPVNEFPGDRSWGYNPSDPYAIESAFGGPDGLKRFVKTCHENGLAVLIDVVHNHYGPSDLQMWQYDGWSQNGLGGIYFYNDWKAHTDWGSTRPDYGRAEVRDYIQGQIRMFLEEYKVDGFRWDSVYNIRHASGTWNQIGSDMLWDINTMARDEFNDTYRIAEDHAFDTDVRFEAEWDHGFLADIRWLATAQSDSDRNMNTLAWHLANGGFNRVVYVESHDTCGDLNNKHRLPRDIDAGNPQSYWAKKRALLAHSIVLLSPGVPMVFAGSEMNEDWTFSNNTALRWSLTNSNAGIVRAFSDLIHLRRNLTGVSAALKEVGKVNVHHVNNTQQIVGAIRWSQGGQTDDLVIVLNASATARTGYALGFPSAGTWYCLFNSDSQTYDASFGGVGPEMGEALSVTGSDAALDLGAYSVQIYSKSAPPMDSAAAFAPPAPSGCGTELTITYTPADGPLKSASNVFAFIGRNNWQGPSNVAMAVSGATRRLVYPIPQDTFELNLSFTDGAGTWDNNEGANWRVLVANCGDLPAAVALSPAVPQGCIPVKFTYEINAGPLTNGSPPVTLFLGRNNWQAPQHLTMTNESGDLWSVWHVIPDDTWELNYVFHNASNIWDNNNQRDWRAIVSACVNTEQPALVVTNPAPNTSVAASETNQALRGRANLLAGHLRWTNQLNGATGTLAYATNWSIAAVPLAEGVNIIRVSGTNSHVNPNHGAWDSPTNAAYNSAWVNGANGGSLFKPWILSSNGYGSVTASSAPSNTQGGQLSFGPRAWALQASGGGSIQAIRPFAAALKPGDRISFVFENGWVDGSPSSVGVAFQNRFDQRLAEFYFDGGSTNFVINDTSLRNTGIPWSDAPKTCTFEMLGSLDYRLTVNGQAFEGEFAPASELLVSRIRFWNYNAGGTVESRFYIGELSVTGAPLPVLTYSAEIAVTRQASALRQTESWISANGQLMATVNNPAGLEGNVWSADTLLNHGWNWSPLPSTDYAISNHTVIILPGTNTGLRLISIGKPGGP